jgi:hypothetical protein
LDKVKWKDRIREDEDRLIYSEHAKVVVVNFGTDHFGRKGLRKSKIT